MRLVDAASLEGVFKSVRYRIGRYPAVLIDKDERFTGKDLSPIAGAIERRLGASQRKEGV